MNHAGDNLIETLGLSAGVVINEPARGVLSVPPGLPWLAIVGSHPATRELAPYEDERYRILLFNEAAMKPEVYRRWDMLLQIHAPEVYASHENWVNKDHWTWLQQKHGKPIYMQDVDPRIPDSVRYPIEGVLAMVPYRYLRSSPAMALALAIYQGYRRIELYGSDLTSNTEYSYQAVNYAFWIGLAHGRGVDLRLKCWENEFYHQPLYGYDGELDLDHSIYEQRRAENEKAWKVNDMQFTRLKDRLDNALLDHKTQEVIQILPELDAIAQAAGETAGAMGEDERYSQRTNPISRQEFERVAAQAQIDYSQSLRDMYHNGGVIEYVYNAWAQTGRHEALNQLRQFVKAKLMAAYTCGLKKGIYSENIFYMGRYDEGLRAAGGIRALGLAGKVVEVQNA